MSALAEKEAGIKAQGATIKPGWQQKDYLREALAEVNTQRGALRAAETAAAEADGDKAERRRRALSRSLAAAAVWEDRLGQDRLQRTYFRFASDPDVIYVRCAPDAAEGAEGAWGYVPLGSAEGDALWAALLPHGEREGRLRAALTARGLERCCLVAEQDDKDGDDEADAAAPAAVALEPPGPRTTRRGAAGAAAAAPKPSKAAVKAAAESARAAEQLARDSAAPPGSPPARDALPPLDADAVAAAAAEEEDLAVAAARSALLSLRAAMAVAMPRPEGGLGAWNAAVRAAAAAAPLAEQLLELEKALYDWLAPFGVAIAADEGDRTDSNEVVDEVEGDEVALWRLCARGLASRSCRTSCSSRAGGSVRGAADAPRAPRARSRSTEEVAGSMVGAEPKGDKSIASNTH